MYPVAQDIQKLRVDVKLYTVSFADWLICDQVNHGHFKFQNANFQLKEILVSQYTYF